MLQWLVLHPGVYRQHRVGWVVSEKKKKNHTKLVGVDSGGVMGEEGEEVEGKYDQNIFEITKELIRVLD